MHVSIYIYIFIYLFIYIFMYVVHYVLVKHIILQYTGFAMTAAQETPELL